jgi:hypothetical protein
MKMRRIKMILTLMKIRMKMLIVRKKGHIEILRTMTKMITSWNSKF